MPFPLYSQKSGYIIEQDTFSSSPALRSSYLCIHYDDFAHAVIILEQLQSVFKEEAENNQV